MIKIAIDTVDRALELVSELRREGLIANEDFEWSFVPSPEQIWGEPRTSHHVIFEFRDPRLDLFYQMKWL